MKRLVPLIMCICMVTVFVFGAVESRAGDQVDQFVHFTVLPQKLDDGSDTWPLMMQFKTEVMKLAGGFTELGPSRGGALYPESIHHQENISFLIAANKDVSAELKEIIQRLFNDDKTFILVWKGKLTR